MHSFDPKQDITLEAAHIRIQYILDCGLVAYTTHAKDRMVNRNFTTQDVIYILETGDVIKKEYNDAQKHWKYTVAGPDLDGDEGDVITAILSGGSQLIITVF